MPFLKIKRCGTVCFKENYVRQMQRRQEQIHATGVFKKDARSQNISAKYRYKTPLQTFISGTIGASQKKTPAFTSFTFAKMSFRCIALSN